MIRVLRVASAFMLALLGGCVAVKDGGTFLPCTDPLTCVSVQKGAPSRNCLGPDKTRYEEWTATLDSMAKGPVMLSLREELQEENVSPRPPKRVYFPIVEVAGGPGISLGCARDFSETSPAWTARTISKLNACWKNQCPSPPSAVTEARRESCETSCGQGSKFCLKAHLDAANLKEFSEFNRRLLIQSAAVPFKTLFQSAATPLMNCRREDALINLSGTFRSIGRECALDLQLLPSPTNDADFFGVRIPAVLDGMVEWFASPRKYQITPVEVGGINFATVLFMRSSGTESDVITRIEGRPGQIMLETEKTYCVAVSLPLD